MDNENYMTVEEMLEECRRTAFDWRTVRNSPLVGSIVILYVPARLNAPNNTKSRQVFARYQGSGQFVDEQGTKVLGSHWRLNCMPNAPQDTGEPIPAPLDTLD